MVQINGESVQADGMILTDYLTEHGYQITRIAIERNGEIVPKATYDQVILQPDDRMEIVSFVGGG